MAPQKSKYIELEFVNVTNPREYKNVGHQKTIRKHNMLRYWHGRNKASSDPCLSKRHLLPMKSITKRSRGDYNAGENEKNFSSSNIGDPRDRLGSGERDPFASYSIPAAPYIDELLRYWLTHLSSVFCTTDEVTNSVTPTPKAFLPMVISNAAMFHALLAFSSSMVDSSYGRKIPSTRTLEHMGSAITLVNQALGDAQHATDDKVLLTICLMTGSHCIFRDYPNHELHVNGMHQIILLRGGIETLRAAPVIFRLILWADQFRGLYTSTLPRYRIASNLPGSPSIARDPASEATSLGSEAWSMRGFLSERFISLMEQITDLQQHIESCREASISHATLRDFYSQRDRIKECLIASIAEAYIDPSEYRLYEQCCLLAAALHFHVVTRPLPIWSGVQVTLLQKLKDALIKTDSVSYWGDDIELLLWVLMQAVVLDDPLKLWFTELLRHVLRAFVPRLSLEQVKDILRRFLWNERISGPACERVYKEIQSSF